jgi:hypothetical protein
MNFNFIGRVLLTHTKKGFFSFFCDFFFLFCFALLCLVFLSRQATRTAFERNSLRFVARLHIADAHGLAVQARRQAVTTKTTVIDCQLAAPLANLGVFAGAIHALGALEKPFLTVTALEERGFLWVYRVLHHSRVAKVVVAVFAVAGEVDGVLLAVVAGGHLVAAGRTEGAHEDLEGGGLATGDVCPRTGHFCC